MKAAKIVLILLLVSALILWVKGTESFPLARILPFLGGQKPPIFEAGALALIALLAWGMARLRRHDPQDNTPDTTLTDYDAGEDEWT